MIPEISTYPGEDRVERFRHDDAEHTQFLNSRLATARNELIRHYLAISLQSREVPLKEFLNRLEKQLIESALFVSFGNQRRASSVLGVKPTCLNEKIKRFGIHKLIPPQTAQSIERLREMLRILPD